MWRINSEGGSIKGASLRGTVGPSMLGVAEEAECSVQGAFTMKCYSDISWLWAGIESRFGRVTTSTSELRNNFEEGNGSEVW